jgi:hypothetical protein
VPPSLRVFRFRRCDQDRVCLTAVSPVMLWMGVLVSITWAEPSILLKLAEVLHSTVGGDRKRDTDVSMILRTEW